MALSRWRSLPSSPLDGRVCRRWSKGRRLARAALVHDEYGHFEGIVTNADVLEAIIGASRTDEGAPEPDAVQREDRSWLIAGRMAVDEMAERLSIDLPAERSYHTAAGFVPARLGRLPGVGETFEAFGSIFEIVDIGGRRIDKILVRRVSRRRGGK